MKVQRYRRKLFLTTVKSMSTQENCPGKRDEIFSYKHKRNSSRLPGQFCCFDIDLTVVKNSLRQYL
jgi:hypothetical protein